MTQEEKAQAYDKALKRAKKFHTINSDNKNLKAVLELIFPELAESEDERIINELQAFLASYGADYFGTGQWQKFEDWLEKLKEQKPAENNGKELLYVCNEAYKTGYRDGKRDAEQKPAEWSEEDEKIMQTMIKDGDLKPSEIAWLKSLRNRPKKSDSWKPSEEQMEALKECGECKRCLKELYEQLKNL